MRPIEEACSTDGVGDEGLDVMPTAVVNQDGDGDACGQPQLQRWRFCGRATSLIITESGLPTSFQFFSVSRDCSDPADWDESLHDVLFKLHLTLTDAEDSTFKVSADPSETDALS